jgi:hypothetical protein
MVVYLSKPMIMRINRPLFPKNIRNNQMEMVGSRNGMEIGKCWWKWKW